MAQQENEYKYELSEASYHALLTLCPELAAPLRFSNAYFVAAEDTGRRDWVLRLRRGADGPGELTLKVGREVTPGMFSSLEYTAMVSSDNPADWRETEPLRVFQAEISRADLVFQGLASNERRLVKAPLGPVEGWEVDRTVLPDETVFFELEIEWPPSASPTPAQLADFRQELEAWMEANSLLPVLPSRKTKYRRFLEAVNAD